ncbi:MAG TPA: hypothetical protein VGA08_01330 [Candidatus Saccharimonadales bacterium]
MELATKPERITRQPAAEVALSGVCRVLVGGFDNAGKSTLACSLFENLRQNDIDTSLYELDRWSDTHDAILGRKDWSQRSKRAEVSLTQYYDYAQYYLNDQSTIVIGDLEGRQQNQHILQLAGCAQIGILVTRGRIQSDETSQFLQTEDGWRDLFAKIEVPIDFHVRSVREHQAIPINTLPIYGLERISVPDNPGIKKLAALLIERAQCL